MSQHTHHVTSARTYYVIFAILLVLMALTVGAHYIDLGGPVNIMIAMGIAVAKTVLIVLYFMHVRLSNIVVKIFAAAAFFWMVLMFVLIMMDYVVRGWPPPTLFNFAS